MRCPRRSVLNRLCFPHLLPQSPKAGAGRGGGGTGRTVTQMLFWLGGPYCHANVVRAAPSRRGKCWPFFSLCVFCVWFVSFVVFFAVLLFLGSLFEKIFGSELLFLGVVVGLVFFDSVLPRFLFYNLVFRSRKCLGKILFMSGLLFLGVCSFSLWFCRRRRLFVFVFCFFQERKLRTNRAHPHTHLVFLFLFLVFVPAAPGLSPILAVRPSFLAFCRGAILGPGRFLDSPGTPLRLFLGREAAWVLLVASLFVVFFFPLLCCLRLHTFS